MHGPRESGRACSCGPLDLDVNEFADLENRGTDRAGRMKIMESSGERAVGPKRDERIRDVAAAEPALEAQRAVYPMVGQVVERPEEMCAHQSLVTSVGAASPKPRRFQMPADSNTRAAPAIARSRCRAGAGLTDPGDES